MITYQISFSGGLGSAISAFIAHEQGLNFNLIFADTLIEDEDLYRFINDVSKAISKDIVWLKDGRTPWDVYVDRRWIGNSRTAHCSTELKTKQVRKWLDENALPDDPLVLGMDWSEIDRIERAQKIWNRPVVSLLNEFKVYRTAYDDYLKKYGIRTPRLYSMGFSHNNCGGFCCKAGLKQFKNLYYSMPLRFKHHANEMDRVMNEIGPTAKPFLKQNGEYITLNEYGAQLEAGRSIDLDFGGDGCGCFTDEEPT